MEVKVLKSEFNYSVPKLSLMHHIAKEAVLIGRSNAGKSSLINALGNKKNLARTSKTPGRTRHAVVYSLLLSLDDQEKAITLVDLPGFGFAHLSKIEAKDCEALIFSYLEKRLPLHMIILLLDIRRVPDEREQKIIEIARRRKVDLLLVLTKCDKIAATKRRPILAKVASDLAIDKNSIMLHSILENQFIGEVQKAIFEKF